ncbi:MAG: hypothetical protein ABI867_40000 [Kofleriaceae bacterium]
MIKSSQDMQDAQNAHREVQSGSNAPVAKPKTQPAGPDNPPPPPK